MAFIQCSLSGAIRGDVEYELFIQHLRNTSSSGAIPFTLREVCFSDSFPLDEKKQTEVRLRCLLEGDSETWTLRHTQISHDHTVKTNLKDIVEIGVSPNAELFLEKMGFVYKFEIYKQGLRFVVRTEENNTLIHIFVSKLKCVSERGSIDLKDLPFDNDDPNSRNNESCYLVEVESIFDNSESKLIADTANHLINYASSLFQMIVLSK